MVHMIKVGSHVHTGFYKVVQNHIFIELLKELHEVIIHVCTKRVQNNILCNNTHMYIKKRTTGV